MEQGVVIETEDFGTKNRFLLRKCLYYAANKFPIFNDFTMDSP